MPFDENVHTSTSHYEREVVKETARRMRATDENSNMLLSGVLQNLKRSGVTESGMLPKEVTEVFGNVGPFVSKAHRDLPSSAHK